MRTRFFFFLAICFLIGIINKPAKAGMKFDLSSQLNDTTGDVQVQSTYNGNSKAYYSLSGRGIYGKDIKMENTFLKGTSGSITTSTTASFESQPNSSVGILEVKEKVGVQSVTDNECFAGAIGAGIGVTKIESFDSKGLINPGTEVTYELTAENGSGRLGVGAEGRYLKEDEEPESVTYHYGVDADFGHFYGKYELSSE